MYPPNLIERTQQDAVLAAAAIISKALDVAEEPAEGRAAPGLVGLVSRLSSKTLNIFGLGNAKEN